MELYKEVYTLLTRFKGQLRSQLAKKNFNFYNKKQCNTNKQLLLTTFLILFLNKYEQRKTLN